MHVCVCGTYICIHPYVRIYTKFINRYLNAYIMNMYIHVHTFVHTYTHTYIHTNKHTYMHTYMHKYIHAQIHVFVHTYIHTHTHTCIRIQRSCVLNPPSRIKPTVTMGVATRGLWLSERSSRFWKRALFVLCSFAKESWQLRSVLL